MIFINNFFLRNFFDNFEYFDVIEKRRNWGGKFFICFRFLSNSSSGENWKRFSFMPSTLLKRQSGKGFTAGSEALFDVAVNGFFQSFSLHPRRRQTFPFSILRKRKLLHRLDIRAVWNLACCFSLFSSPPPRQPFVKALAGNCYFIFLTIVGS